MTATGGRALLVADIVALCVLSAVLGVLGSFLSLAVPHLWFVPVPVGILLAVVGNLAVGVLGARGAGSRLAPACCAVVWLAVAVVLGTQRAEGDLIVTGQSKGVVFLLLGTAAAAVAIGVTPRAVHAAPGPGSSPAAPGGR